MNRATIFAVALRKDPLFGYIPTPYLLQKDPHIHYHKTYKQLIKSDFDQHIIPQDDWLKLFLEKSEALKHEQLNERFNKKPKKLPFDRFFKAEKKPTQQHILEQIDQMVSSLLEMIKERKPLIFFKENSPSNVYPEDLIELADEAVELKFFFESRSETLHYKLGVLYQGKELDLRDGSTYIISNSQAYFIYKNRLYWSGQEDFNGNKLKPFLSKEEIVVPQRLKGDFFSKFIIPAVKKFNYQIKGFQMKETKVSKKALIVLEEGFGGVFLIIPHFVYGQNTIAFYSEQKLFVEVETQDNEYALNSIKRHSIYEGKMLKTLGKLGLQKHRRYYSLSQSISDKYEFMECFAELYEALSTAGFSIENRLFQQNISFAEPKIHQNLQEKQDWFDLNIVIELGAF